MKDRPLSAEEAALWARVVASVEPLSGRAPITRSPSPLLSIEGEKSLPRDQGVQTPLEADGAKANAPAKSASANTLDGSWDRRLGRGMVAPDVTVDLHGHTLATAYRTLDAGLEQGIARGDRMLLLITGKPRESGSGRGLIRAAIGDWIAASRHAGHIAAVRGAHPRHGGTGALYIILKRPRSARTF